eukprot:TRINITY_DN2280_c0_g1_i1.p1 TRINITY_DN2280_c0_g1~~TRINITY_DN2280_c0_g1_i1.p1  ORF type:complete len:672 (-),score=152.04 TRINITY_DN2280_c0_g1_i1:117-2132(-)
MFNIFKFRSSSKKADDARPSTKENEEGNTNTLNELQFLSGHTDIVRLLVKIDESRFASGADDGTIIVWNHATGERLVTLRGHTLPVTCMLLVQRNRLVSGSSDKCIRIWNIEDGECLSILSAHQGSVRCLASLSDGAFVSGGNDRQLCVWSVQGELMGTIERQEDENLHSMICISDKTLVTGSNSSMLLVYNTDNMQCSKLLAYHRESVQCLVRLSNKLFASASLDGSIVVWQTDGLTPFNILHYPEKYKNDSKVFIYSVRCLLPLTERYLAAGLASGWQVYDVLTADCITEMRNAHDSDINCLIPLYNGTRLLSCSSDSSIKVWGTPPQGTDFVGRRKNTPTLPVRGPATPTSSPQLRSQPSPAPVDSRNVGDSLRSVITPRSGNKKRKPPPPQQPVLLGEMWGHSEAVLSMLGVSETSLVSCGGDGAVLLWKDGRVQSELRNKLAAVSLAAHKHQGFDDYFEQSLNNMPEDTWGEGDLDVDDDNDVLAEGNYISSVTQDMSGMSYPSPRITKTLSANSLLLPPRRPSIRRPEPVRPGMPLKKSDSLPDPITVVPPVAPSAEPPSLDPQRAAEPEPSTQQDPEPVRRNTVKVPESVVSNAKMLVEERGYSMDQVAAHLRDAAYSDAVVYAVLARLGAPVRPALEEVEPAPAVARYAGSGSVIEDYHRIDT